MTDAMLPRPRWPIMRARAPQGPNHDTDRITAFRLRIAVEILLAWTSDTSPNTTVRLWVAAGMHGPLPWPRDPMFARWAANRGLSEIGGFVGLSLTTGDLT